MGKQKGYEWLFINGKINIEILYNAWVMKYKPCYIKN